MLLFGCIAGALSDTEYKTKLAGVGFANVEIEQTRIYDIEDARQFLGEQGINVDEIAPRVAGKFMSAFIRASKPEVKDCCASSCCGAATKAAAAAAD